MKAQKLAFLTAYSTKMGALPVTLLIVAAVLVVFVAALILQATGLQSATGDLKTLARAAAFKSEVPHTPPKHIPLQEPSFDPTTNSLTDEDINRKLAGLATRNEVEESIEFLTSRGYVPPDVLEMYRNYSEEVLQALGNDGDLAALGVLAGQYADKDYDQFKNAVLKSIVYGSISFAQVQADLYSTQSEFELANPNGGNSELAKLDFLLSLSWYEFIKMRGGGEAVTQLVDARIAKSAFTISPADRATIQSQGAAIYAELSNERQRLGVGEYDNSVPPGLENFLALIGIY
ncbi:hypothetical protein QFX18_06040 [Saccharophagus degradans]|uniref:hypothetical protein n=1 Tax=Saccharophagus degradans TaxID=86304 RepID=UPI0024780380|nr:hypothetical protein [Saccharophagus degradans]WGO99623.1 hypothetical protein QFX18_06040 [Saccharophagus degradans]